MVLALPGQSQLDFESQILQRKLATGETDRKVKKEVLGRQIFVDGICDCHKGTNHKSKQKRMGEKINIDVKKN